MLGGAAAADAGGTEVFLLQRHAAAGNADLILHLELASQLPAPHGLIKAVGAVRDLVHFVHIVGDVGIGFAVGEGFGIEAVVDLLQQAGNLAFEILQLDKGLFAVIATDQHALAGFDILGADLQAKGYALHLILGELPAGAVLGKIYVCTEVLFEALTQGGSGLGNALLMLGDGDDHDLDRSDSGGQHQAVIITVGHNNGADDAGRHTPAGLVRILQGIVAVGELDIKGTGKAVAEVVGGTALQALTVVHHGLDGVGFFGARKFFLIGLDALNNGDGKIFLTHLCVDIQHAHGLSLGFLGGFEMVLEARSDASYADLQRAADTLLYYASQRKEISGLSSSIQNDIPQLYFDVDRDKAQMLGVKIADIFSTLKTFTGSIYVNDFNMFNRIYRVYIQAEAPYRAHKDNLGLFFVKGSNNAMIPITALGTTSYTTGPGTIRRFNMFTSTTISGEAAPGYSSGQAMAILEEIASKHLPKNIGVEWSGLSYQEKHVSGQTAYILALALLFVFLFLAAQYESWSIPIAVILSLPIAGVGAYLGNWICGLENNIYFQIGLVMLVGLVAKNAILIVEFAKDEVEKGNNAVDAVIKAAHLRFRPIVMTSLAFILGMLPLVFASGPGSASRQGIGTGVFFGMIVAITVGIIFVPLLFVWVYKLKSKMMKR